MVVFTRSELINSLTEFYTDLLKDTARDVIKDGNSIVPAIILEEGIEELNNENLVACAETFGNVMCDSDATIDAVMLFNDNTLYTIATYMRNENIEVELEEYRPSNIPVSSQPMKSKKSKKKS